MNGNPEEFFQIYAEEPVPPIIELQNINHEPVGVLYLSIMRWDQMAVSETTNSERYLLYIDGIGIYFSYFRKINKT